IQERRENQRRRQNHKQGKTHKMNCPSGIIPVLARSIVANADAKGRATRLVWKLLGVVTIAAALYGVVCSIFFVFPSVLRTYPDRFFAWSLRIMAAASLGLTLCLVLSAVNLIIAKRPRWTLLTATYGVAWLYHGVVLFLPDLLSDSAR